MIRIVTDSSCDLPDEVLERLAAETRGVVAVFGEGEALRRIPLLGNADALIFTPPNEYAQSLAAQLIFGVWVSQASPSSADGITGHRAFQA